MLTTLDYTFFFLLFSQPVVITAWVLTGADRQRQDRMTTSSIFSSNHRSNLRQKALRWARMSCYPFSISPKMIPEQTTDMIIDWQAFHLCWLRGHLDSTSHISAQSYMMYGCIKSLWKTAKLSVFRLMFSTQRFTWMVIMNSLSSIWLFAM